MQPLKTLWFSAIFAMFAISAMFGRDGQRKRPAITRSASSGSLPR